MFWNQKFVLYSRALNWNCMYIAMLLACWSMSLISTFTLALRPELMQSCGYSAHEATSGKFIPGKGLYYTCYKLSSFIQQMWDTCPVLCYDRLRFSIDTSTWRTLHYTFGYLGACANNEDLLVFGKYVGPCARSMFIQVVCMAHRVERRTQVAWSCIELERRVSVPRECV